METAAEARSASRSTKDDQVLLQIWRQGGSRFVVITKKENQ
jgi:hypothetical protein